MTAPWRREPLSTWIAPPLKAWLRPHSTSSLTLESDSVSCLTEELLLLWHHQHHALRHSPAPPRPGTGRDWPTRTPPQPARGLSLAGVACQSVWIPLPASQAAASTHCVMQPFLSHCRGTGTSDLQCYHTAEWHRQIHMKGFHQIYFIVPMGIFQEPNSPLYSIKHHQITHS